MKRQALAALAQGALPLPIAKNSALWYTSRMDVRILHVHN